MSHFKERKEKNCLNCNANVQYKFCGICGQENIEPKESIWHLIKHVFEDITHFDGKFFSSLKYLLFKPGFLSSEYVRGRRQAYLNPVRFYIFTSFIFFLIVLSVAKNNSKSKDNNDSNTGIISIKTDDDNKEVEKDTSTISYNVGYKKGRTNSNKVFFSDYRDKKEYDSLLLAKIVNDNYFEKTWTYNRLKAKEKYKSNKNDLLKALGEKFYHNLGILFLVSLPFLAIFLKLIYLRKRNRFYVAHTIFCIHLYIFTYMGILVNIIIGAIKNNFHLSFLRYIILANFLLIIFYWYKAFRNFYEQSRFKTFVKCLLVSVWFIFILFVLFLIYFFYTLFNV